MSLIFSKNTTKQISTQFRTYGEYDKNPREKYLELPSFVGQLRKRVFVNIKTKVCQKLNFWKEQLLSQGGKEVVLFKVVTLVIPTCVTSYFMLLINLTIEIENLMAKFW